MPPLKLWVHKASPPCNAVVMLVDILGLNVELVDVDLGAKENLSEEFRKINPMGTIPTLQDGNYFVSESHAIIPYLVEKYGGEKKSTLYPFDLETRATINERMYFDAGVFFVKMKLIGKPIFFGSTEPADPTLLAEVVDAYGVLESYLGRSRYIAADHPTIADLSIGSTAFAVQAVQPLDRDRFPKVSAWLEALEKEPHFAKIMRPNADLLQHIFDSVWKK